MHSGRIISVVVCGLVFLVSGACTRDRPTSKPSASASASAQRAVVDVAALINNGIVAAGKGQFDQAKADFEQALKVDPKNKFAWFNLGFLAEAHKDTAGAVKAYDKALESDPLYTPALYNKAIIVEASNADAAIVLYRRILDVDDKAATTLVRLGLLMDKKGDKDQARSAFGRAVKVDPTLASAVPPAYRVNGPSVRPGN
jgi:tetratricopeptide (TPR) repeat protein